MTLLRRKKKLSHEIKRLEEECAKLRSRTFQAEIECNRIARRADEYKAEAEKNAEELTKYKVMYADEVARRVELAKFLSEKMGGTNE